MSDGATELLCDVSYASGRFAYVNIPTEALRHFCDHLLGEKIAELNYADFIQGKYHRWKGGHDLLIDIPGSFADSDKSGVKHLLHVLGTDFPTKDGIPIPGLSAGGLGSFLADTCGIPKGWMCLNLFDADIGILSISESSSDLLAAFSGEMTLNTWTFFDTFGEGTFELILGAYTQNPLLCIASAEDYMAGVKLLVDRVSDGIVSLQDVAIGSLTGAVVASLLTVLFEKHKPSDELAKDLVCNVFRASIIGALSAVHPMFAIGASLGMLGYRLPKLADIFRSATVTQEQVDYLRQIYCADPEYRRLLQLERQYIGELIRLSVDPVPVADPIFEEDLLSMNDSVPKADPVPEVK